MALVLVVENGSGLTTSNSYATAAEGDSYHEKHTFASTWTGASTATKEAALCFATRLLDQHVAWYGARCTETQALRWPRLGLLDQDGYEIDSNVVPPAVKNATAELARLLIASDRSADPSAIGIRSVKAGSVAVEFDKSWLPKEIPESAWIFISHLGARRGAESVAKHLVRA